MAEESGGDVTSLACTDTAAMIGRIRPIGVTEIFFT